ncbi:uncharacterized protein LOC135378789 [Ornithodoros turicata]|uniref:uncharacterized protein LOC135378789 n=1 Tax=Ornithodoros turicata TaxID=34597 RepID=UPI003138893F
MSSVRAATTAKPSRDEGYKMILPTIPSGTVALNTVFLHADPTGRPYNIGHFSDALKDKVVRSEVTSVGPFLFNHLWALTFNSVSAKDKFLSLSELAVKEKRCVLIDRHKKELHIKMHWLPQHVPDEAIEAALERYGAVTNIVREKWKDSFFEGAESTTRQAVITLKNGVTADSLPHQMYVCGCQVLVAIPGRPPLCLRCKGVGHIRKQCHTPWCKTCRRFGHEEDECVVTYASRVRQQHGSQDSQHNMECDDDADGAAPVAAPVPSSAAAPAAATVASQAGTPIAPAMGDPQQEEEKSVLQERQDTASSSLEGSGNEATEEIEDDFWITPKRKKGRKSAPATMPPKIVEVDRSVLDDIGFLSA